MEKVELTSDECYSIAFVVYQEWKELIKSNGVFNKKNKPFITWLEEKQEQERIKNLKPSGDIPRFMLK